MPGQNDSPFPDDPFKESSINPGPGAISFTPTVDHSTEFKAPTSLVASSGDPFGNLGSLMLPPQTDVAALVTAQTPASTVATSGLDHNSSSPFPADPFADLTATPGEMTNQDIPESKIPPFSRPLDNVDGIGKIDSIPVNEDSLASMASLSFPAPSNLTEASGGSTSLTDTGMLDSVAKASSLALAFEASTPAPVEPSSGDKKSEIVGSSPFSDDPFADMNMSSGAFLDSAAALNASSTANIPISSNSNMSPLKVEAAKSDDPFADLGGTKLGDNPFPSDPFAGSDVFSSDLSFNANSAVMSGLGEVNKDSGATTDNTGDRYAAFADFGETPQSTVHTAGLPSPPSDWFASVEKDALTSDQSDHLALTGGSQMTHTKVDFSIQTSDSGPLSPTSSEVSQLNATFGGIVPSTSNGTSVPLPTTTDLSGGSKPPALPKKQGPPRPRPPSISRSVSKDESGAGQENQNKPDVRSCDKRCIGFHIYNYPW